MKNPAPILLSGVSLTNRPIAGKAISEKNGISASDNSGLKTNTCEGSQVSAGPVQVQMRRLQHHGGVGDEEHADRRHDQQEYHREGAQLAERLP